MGIKRSILNYNTFRHADTERSKVPDAIHVFDHFHVVKLMNDKLDDIRRVQYSMEKDINKRKVLKGTRYLWFIRNLE